MANEYQSELDRINQNIADTYSVLSDAGAATPAVANSENLASTASSIAAVLYNKDQGLSNTQKEQARTNIGALAESELDSAITDALAQAKESGEFDGVSVAVSNVSESTEDGGDNVVTFTDGKTVKVKNGSRGSQGIPGPAYTLTDADKEAIAAAVKASLTTETWTFTLEDGTRVTKVVYVG